MLAFRDETIQLVEHAQVGNIEAFTSLVQNYEHEIYGFLVNLLGDHDEAHDLTQQVFLKAWLRLATLHDASCFKTWLYTIARNLARDYWRSKKTHYQTPENLEVNNVTTSMPSPEDCVAKAELINLALAELSPKLRQCLLLRFVGGFSPHEIASRIGISQASVSTYLSTARKQFRIIYHRLENEQDIKHATPIDSSSYIFYAHIMSTYCCTTKRNRRRDDDSASTPTRA